MKKNIPIFKAPDGSELIGCMVNGRALLDYIPAERTNEIKANSWMTSGSAKVNLLTKTMKLDVRGQQMTYLDENGAVWLEKHLIGIDAEPLPAVITAQMLYEAMTARLWEMIQDCGAVAAKLGEASATSQQVQTWLRITGKAIVSSAEHCSKLVDRVAGDIEEDKNRHAL